MYGLCQTGVARGVTRPASDSQGAFRRQQACLTFLDLLGVARVRDPDGRLVYLGLQCKAAVRSRPGGGAA